MFPRRPVAILGPHVSTATPTPSAELTLSDDEVVITIEIAGFEQDLEIDLRPRTICVTGHRTFELPPDADGREARAEVTDGLLVIRTRRRVPTAAHPDVVPT